MKHNTTNFKLFVASFVTIFCFFDSAFAQNTFPSTGNVGINTLSPIVPLEVRGDVKFIDPGSMEEISFARPGGENGFNLTSTMGSSAHFKFDGLTLRLLTHPAPGGVPSNTNGLAIERTYGWVGLGTTTPQCRFQLNDMSNTNYGGFFNTNSLGPSLFVDRNSNGNLNPSGFLTGSNGSVFLNSYYSGFPGGEMVSGYFENTDPGQDISIGVKSLSKAVSAGSSITSVAFDGVAKDAWNSYGLLSYAEGSLNTYGVYANGGGGIPLLSGVSNNFGVYGLGLGADCKSNTFGVYGQALNGEFNYGVYGTTFNNSGVESCGKNWAGYFTGDVFASNYMTPSDIQFKENIKPLNNAINIISKLNPQTYTFKKSDAFLGLNLPEGIRYGFIAQELETILPNLVKKSHNPEIKDKKGNIISKSFDFKSVDYTSLIPILIQGIKEQQIQIEELKSQISANSNKVNNNGKVSEISAAILYQNTPNPFSENTLIKYHLLNNNDAASIMIFDMNGKLIKSYDLNTQNLDGEVQISSGSLLPGMYYYSLVVNGTEINTLKMILAK